MELDHAQLRALSAAVETGSLDAAARRLHVTPSAVSQRLRALETATGRVLLVRSRPVRVTDSGRVVLRLARQLDLLVADTTAELAGEETAELTLAVNADSLATWLLPALAPLADTLRLRFRREDEGRTSALLRDGSVVGAVTTDARPVTGCSVTPLGVMRYHAMAAPSFRTRWFADGPTAAAYARAPVVVFDADDPLQHRHLAAQAPGARPPVHAVPASEAFVAAVRLGYGWAMLPALQVAAEEASGALVRLDAGPAADVPLFWQQWRLRTPSLDRIAAAVVAGARASLTGAAPNFDP